MIDTPLTHKALRLAYAAHQGQTDKAGLPYIFHPYHVAEQMTDEFSVCAALLHDVVEDTDVTLAQLEQEFPQEVTDAIQLLTHEPGTDYFTYIRAIRKNSLAKRVKLADLEHNSDESRLCDCAEVSPEQRARLREKYAKARAILEEPEWFRIQMSQPWRTALPLEDLDWAKMEFVEYAKGEDGIPSGVTVLCDLGRGPDFDNGSERVTLLPGQPYSFVHEYAGFKGRRGTLRITVNLLPINEP